jgi:hypothetical protein
MISKVCRWKKVQRFFHHEASGVEPVLYVLHNHESIIQTIISGTAHEDAVPQIWEACFALLVWMGMCLPAAPGGGDGPGGVLVGSEELIDCYNIRAYRSFMRY